MLLSSYVRKADTRLMGDYDNPCPFSSSKWI